MRTRTVGRAIRAALPLLVVLASGAAQAQPANDDCAAAIPLVDGPNGPFTTVGATSNPADPSSSCTTGSDAWFTYTATCTGAVTFSTCGTPSPGWVMTLSTYTGVCGSLAYFGCNGAICGLGSQTTVDSVAAGQTVHLRVGGIGTGTFGINVTCTPTLPNDECATAIPLVDGLNAGFSNFGATLNPVPPNSFCSGAHDVWFSYTASCAGSVTFSLCPPASASFPSDTLLAAFTGTCGALTFVQCRAGGCGTFETGVTVPSVTPGETVYLRVGSAVPYISGTFSLVVSCQVPTDDFGDAPWYPVNFARHTNAGSGERLGTLVTLETATVGPSWYGDAGDDGIASVSNLFPGSTTATLVVNATNPNGTSLGHCRIWVKGDGLSDFFSSDALPSQSAMIGPSGTSFTFGPFSYPADAPASPFVRVRLSANPMGVVSSFGTAASGEVEDYVLPGTGGPASLPEPIGTGTDAGDAPVPYPPCNSRWTVSRLGPTVTADANCPTGFPTTGDAAWNDDGGDDGIVRISGLAPGGSCVIVVQVMTSGPSAAGLVGGWIDFDGDANWDEPGEIFPPPYVGVGPVPQTATLGPLAVPAGAVVPFRTRIKLYYASTIAPHTAGEDPSQGEVEDYLLPSQDCSACNTQGGDSPSLFAVDPPRLGGTLVVRTVGALPSTSALTVFASFSGPGVDLASFGLPIPPGACFLCVLPQVLFPAGVTDGSGGLTQAFAVPVDPAFAGAPVRLQNLQFLPSGGGLDVVVTNALATEVLPQ